MSDRNKRALLFGLIGLVFICLISFVLPHLQKLVAKQKLDENIKLAGKHIDIVQSVLDKDARFKRVQVTIRARYGGCLSLYGTVETDQDLQDLKALVTETSPPVHVDWRVDDKAFLDALKRIVERDQKK